MKLHLVAAGRLRRGPERSLVDDYLERFARTGRGVGLPPVRVTETGDAPADLGRAVPAGALLVALDERGRTMTSPDLAARMGRWRDEARDAAFVIGAADGLGEVRDRADLLLSFGPMVWPHMLARVMLAEQLFRAASILAGTPYHRA